MDKIIPISDLQTKAKKYVDQVRETEQAVIVTQRGRASAVLVNYELYEGMLATLDEMSFPDWRERLERAKREQTTGKTITLDAYLAKRKRRDARK
jgi:prevent-host-death family protein